MTGFLVAIIGGLLQLMIFALIVSAILSWLVAFNVINIRNPVAYQVVRVLDAVTRPVLRPFQRFIPPLGGVDISPIIAILVLSAARGYLLPWLARPLYALIG
jgi:YggT family protein